MASSTCSRRRLRRSIGARVVAAVVAATLLSGGAVRADAPRAGEAARSAARAKLVEGVDALGRGEHQRALEKFQEAYALVPSPKIHYDFGLAYLGLGRNAEALSAFERFLAEAPDAPADKREKAAQRVAALRSQIGTAGVPVQEASDAKSGGHNEVDRGVQGTRSATPAGGDGGARLALGAPSGPPPDGQATPAPAAGAVLTGGGSAGDPARAQRIAAISIGAAGVVLIGAGLTFGALAKNESDSLSHDSATSEPGNRPTFDAEKEARGMRYETLQMISLAAGAVGLVAGVVLYANSRGRVTVEPAAPRGLAGANVQIRF